MPSTTDPLAPRTARRRRWARFSLRAALAAMTMCAVSLGWLGMRAHAARQEEDALQRLQATHGAANFNVSCANPFRPQADPLPLAFYEGGWPWLRRCLGADIGRTVVGLQIYAPGNTFAYGVDDRGRPTIERTYAVGLRDADLPFVAKFRQLRDLQLEGHPITDVGASSLGELRALRSLNLSATAITDRALPTLERLTELRRLDLSRTDITAAALDSLAALPQLVELNLQATNIGPDALARFQTLRPNCQIDGP